MACSVFFTDSAPHFVTWAASRRAATRRHRRGAWWRLRRCRASRTPPAARTYPRWPCSRRYWPSRSKPPRPAVGGTAAVRLSANRFQSGRVRLHRPARRRRETRARAGLAALPRRRDCVTCGTPITVTTCNPNRRYCSPRCRPTGTPATPQRRCYHVVNDVADAVHTRNDVPDAVRAANDIARCPHCRHELAITAVVIPADAAHVQTPEVIT